jgi:hypothetical protein
MGAAWARHAMCESASRQSELCCQLYMTMKPFKVPNISVFTSEVSRSFSHFLEANSTV